MSTFAKSHITIQTAPHPHSLYTATPPSLVGTGLSAECQLAQTDSFGVREWEEEEEEAAHARLNLRKAARMSSACATLPHTLF